MAKRYNSSANFAGYWNVESATPLDTRAVVEYLYDLTATQETINQQTVLTDWGKYIYQGMQVVVLRPGVDIASNNNNPDYNAINPKVYIFKGDDASNIENWQIVSDSEALQNLSTTIYNNMGYQIIEKRSDLSGIDTDTDTNGNITVEGVLYNIHKIYLVLTDPQVTTGDNIYEEWVIVKTNSNSTINYKWERIGGIDLSEYAKVENSEDINKDLVQTIFKNVKWVQFDPNFNRLTLQRSYIPSNQPNETYKEDSDIYFINLEKLTAPAAPEAKYNGTILTGVDAQTPTSAKSTGSDITVSLSGTGTLYYRKATTQAGLVNAQWEQDNSISLPVNKNVVSTTYYIETKAENNGLESSTTNTYKMVTKRQLTAPNVDINNVNIFSTSGTYTIDTKTGTDEANAGASVSIEYDTNTNINTSNESLSSNGYPTISTITVHLEATDWEDSEQSTQSKTWNDIQPKLKIIAVDASIPTNKSTFDSAIWKTGVTAIKGDGTPVSPESSTTPINLRTANENTGNPIDSVNPSNNSIFTVNTTEATNLIILCNKNYTLTSLQDMNVNVNTLPLEEGNTDGDYKIYYIPTFGGAGLKTFKIV